MGAAAKPFWPAWVVVSFFVLVNLFIYVDRGVVPGAVLEFKQFIQSELGGDNVGVYFGALTSVYICGYAAASFAVGQMVHHFPPFQLVGGGLFLWTAAVTLSALSPNYWVLLVGRALSGIGEASFQAIIAPFIDDYAPEGKRALWIGAFYASIPVGTALGYIVGSTLGSHSALSWRAPFVAEAPVLLVLSIAVCFVRAPPPKAMGGANKHRRDDDVAEEALMAATTTTTDHILHADDADPASDVSLRAGVCRVLGNPKFLTVALGYAAYNFTVAGFGAFAPDFLLELGLFQSEQAASTAIGGAVSGAGLVGTIAGGWLMDRVVARLERSSKSDTVIDSDVGVITSDGSDGSIDPVELEPRLLVPGAAATSSSDEAPDRSTELLAIMYVALSAATVGALASLCLVLLTSDAAGFLTLTFFACTALFAANGAAPLAMMASVLPQDRALAMGVGQIIQHALGDVPSPSIIGAVSDALAPPHAGKERDVNGLRLTLFLTMAWLSFSVLFWSLGTCLAARSARRGCCRKE
jgi:MFS transporter, Spinster family, sphingosine-1-phosphate transporter